MNDLNFLKLIYELGGFLHPVSNGAIAKKARLSNASVTERTKNIYENTEFLTYRRYYGSQLTKKGIELLKPYIQQQRLIETWLVNNLDYSLKDSHIEADILSTSVSDNFVSRLNRYLNYPKICPHGNVIPNNSEIITDDPLTLTDELKKDQTYVVQSFSEDDYIFGLLETVDIKLNDSIKILDIIDGIVIIYNYRTNSKQLLPKVLAGSIRIVETSKAILE
ncbi:Iron-dependent repressor [Companilactobacillus tucceti DSM 20183]|uniref:Iron-dependent repressor n=1 Tax=Companilactobacillus tucceti DSM 20183 TaxID=1423811 RepID=A0A0R1J874_9LACO|nr:metal-dependent transcriptional regulator [Companilactobacillus tucceti]KRK64641.1 Iron-dependent repressor [Companilactobacillus tucceti DSM 20183]